MALSRSRLIIAGVLLTLAVTAAGARQGSAPHAALPFTVIAADSRRPLAATLVGDYVMVSLEDLAALFQLTVREDALAGGVTVSYKGKTVILTPGQALASAAGRLISLPSPLTRDGRRWLVPVEFVSRALAVVYDSRLDVRKNSRMVIVGDVRVPHIVVRQDVLGPQTRVTFAVNPRTPYTLSQEPSRVLVHFDADALDVSLPTFAPQGLLQSIRVSDPSTTITIDVGPRFGSFRATLVPQDDGGGQVLVDLMPATAEPAPSPLARGGVPQIPVPPPPEAPPPVTSPTAGGLSAVVIDPGHGGDEVGSKGAAGTQEKDVTLSLARRLKASLEGRLGVRVLLTRDGDQAIGLDARAALANNTKADLFVSLHANASMRREASGAQIYYMAADQSVEDVRMASASRQTLPTFSGGSREVGMVPWNMAQLRHLSESASLAGAIEEQFRGRVRLNARPVQQAPLRVLTGANMPAVLVEVGFLTNLDEEQQLVSDAYQNTVVQALLDGLLRYRQLADLPAPPEAVPAPSPVPVRRLP